LYNASFDKAYLPYQYYLYIVDGEADTVRTVKSSQGGNVYGMCLNTLQQKVYVPFSYGATGRLMVIDAATDSVLKDISPESCYAACYDSINNTVYMSDNFDSGTVRVINCVNDLVTARIPVGLKPTALDWNPDQNRMYVINSWSGSIAVIRDSFPTGIGAGTFRPAESKPLASVVRGVLNLGGDCPRTGTVPKAVLLDISGRKVLDLKLGANDVRSLAPGVYFVRAVSRELLAVSCHKVVIAR
jgi:YVTN family beta-propeller protein